MKRKRNHIICRRCHREGNDCWQGHCQPCAKILLIVRRCRNVAPAAPPRILPLPEPTDAAPGSQAKRDVLAARLANGQQLWHPDDRRDHATSSLSSDTIDAIIGAVSDTDSDPEEAMAEKATKSKKTATKPVTEGKAPKTKASKPKKTTAKA